MKKIKLTVLVCLIVALVLSLGMLFASCGDTPTPTPPGEETEKPTPKPKYTYEAHIADELPKVYIDTDDGKNDFAMVENPDNYIKEWEYQPCSVSVSGGEGDENLDKARGSVKVRGNYTTVYDKKPLRIKFDSKQKMLGLNDGAAAKSWVLLAEYKDMSMLRNSMAFYLGNQILGADGLYCSDFRYVEVYLNRQYWGLYLLCEQQQVNSHRVNIAEPDKNYKGTDIGYFVEYDGYYAEEAELERFTINHRAPVDIEGVRVNAGNNGYTIKSDVYASQQRDYIAFYLQSVYNICYEATRYDPDDSYTKNYKYMQFDPTYTKLLNVTYDSATPQELVEKVLDVNSLVDMYILQEICCDYDIGWSSFFMSVDMSASGDKKLYFQAPWDFDSAFGLRDRCEDGLGLYAAKSSNPWLLLLIREDWFMHKVSAKWEELINEKVGERALQLLDTLSAKTQSYYTKNYDKWGWDRVYGVVGGEFSGTVHSQAWKSQSDAAAHLKKWLKARLKYFDDFFGPSRELKIEE